MRTTKQPNVPLWASSKPGWPSSSCFFVIGNEVVFVEEQRKAEYGYPDGKSLPEWLDQERHEEHPQSYCVSEIGEPSADALVRKARVDTLTMNTACTRTIRRISRVVPSPVNAPKTSTSGTRPSARSTVTAVQAMAAAPTSITAVSRIPLPKKTLWQEIRPHGLLFGAG